MQQIDTHQAANDAAFFEAVEAALLMDALLLAIEEGEAAMRQKEVDHFQASPSVAKSLELSLSSAR